MKLQQLHQIAIEAINLVGDGLVANHESLRFFRPDYVVICMDRLRRRFKKNQDHANEEQMRLALEEWQKLY